MKDHAKSQFQGNSTAWRFWNKATSTMEYGLGESARKYESRNYVAMRRLILSNPRGGEVFDGDVVRFEHDTESLRVDPNGELHTITGKVRSFDFSRPYVVITQDPLDTFSRQSK